MRTTVFLSFLLFAHAAIGAPVAAPVPANVRIPTVTRLVQMFIQLETDLSDAVTKQDMAAITKLLSDDFEMRIGSMPGNPIPRAEWIKQSIAEPKPSTFIEQMAVHDYDKLAVVSYLLKGKNGKSKKGKVDAAQGLFIVDVWTREPEDWKLAVRYTGSEGKNDFYISGAPMNAPAFEKKE